MTDITETIDTYLVATDIGELGPDGKLRRISAFFGDLPERDNATS